MDDPPPPPRLLERWRKSPTSKSFTPWKETTAVLLPSGGLKYQFAGCEGFVHVFPSLLSPEQRTLVKDELMNFRLIINNEECTAFRKHRIQDQWEPRIQFMMHLLATEDTFGAPQPGYSYAKNVVMKALPLGKFPFTQGLSDQMKDLFCFQDRTEISCNDDDDTFFNIGVHALLYRGGRDAMGFHADDDQEESLIVSAVVMQDRIRSITFRPKGKPHMVEYELHLHAGDVYAMDGVMQETYLHGVPARKAQTEEEVASLLEDDRRLVLVFRRGRYQEFQVASGAPCKVEDFAPILPWTYTYGDAPGLRMNRSYTREELVSKGYHNLRQRGVSGNQHTGCNAIVVSGKKNQSFSCDVPDSFVYAATRLEGAGSLDFSMKNGIPIRVFRSCNYELRSKKPKKGPTLYRYGGLYVIYDCRIDQVDQKTGKTLFQFYMILVETRSSARFKR